MSGGLEDLYTIGNSKILKALSDNFSKTMSGVDITIAIPVRKPMRGRLAFIYPGLNRGSILVILLYI